MPRHDLEEWTDTLFHDELGLSKRKTFSCPSYYKGKKMFCFLYEDGLGVKTDPAVVLQRIEENPDVYQHFKPMGNIMKNWLIIVHPEVSEYEQEREWLVTALKKMP